MTAATPTLAFPDAESFQAAEALAPNHPDLAKALRRMETLYRAIDSIEDQKTALEMRRRTVASDLQQAEALAVRLWWQYTYRINHPDDLPGGSLQGYLMATYRQLREALGEPLSGSPDGKVSTQWRIVNPIHGTARLYDWKHFVNRDSDEPYEWHIGGGEDAVLMVRHLLPTLADAITPA